MLYVHFESLKLWKTKYKFETISSNMQCARRGLANPKVSQVGGMPNVLHCGGGITKLKDNLLFKG